MVAAEAAVRAWQRRAPAALADRLETIVLIVLVIATAGGLGLLLGGSRPSEPLHLLYAILALAALPVASSISKASTPRRRALITVAAAIVTFAVVAKLFQTG